MTGKKQEEEKKEEEEEQEKKDDKYSQTGSPQVLMSCKKRMFCKLSSPGIYKNNDFKKYTYKTELPYPLKTLSSQNTQYKICVWCTCENTFLTKYTI